jgi:hypothetical protein
MKSSFAKFTDGEVEYRGPNHGEKRDYPSATTLWRFGLG